MAYFFKRKQKDPKLELKALLGDFEVQQFPAVVMDVLGMLRDPDSDTGEIAEKIQMDLGMSIKILRLINSASFGLATKVSNLQDAVTLLGRSRLESMLLTYAVANTMPSTLECMEISRFWLASARRACLAKLIAQQLHPATQSECFTAALLQDLAVPFISEVKGPVFTDLLERWHAEMEADIDAMERDLFDYDHPAIGALVAEEWDLPEYLVLAIAGHHDLSEHSSAEPAVRLVSLIRYFDEDDGTERLLKTAEDAFGIGGDAMREMISRSFDEAEQFTASFQ